MKEWLFECQELNIDKNSIAQAAKVTAETLKLLQSEQAIPCAGATFLVTKGGNVAQEVQPQDMVITSGPNLPVQSRVQQAAR